MSTRLFVAKRQEAQFKQQLQTGAGEADTSLSFDTSGDPSFHTVKQFKPKFFYQSPKHKPTVSSAVGIRA